VSRACPDHILRNVGGCVRSESPRRLRGEKGIAGHRPSMSRFHVRAHSIRSSRWRCRHLSLTGRRGEVGGSAELPVLMAASFRHSRVRDGRAWRGRRDRGRPARGGLLMGRLGHDRDINACGRRFLPSRPAPSGHGIPVDPTHRRSRFDDILEFGPHRVPPRTSTQSAAVPPPVPPGRDHFDRTGRRRP